MYYLFSALLGLSFMSVSLLGEMVAAPTLSVGGIQSESTTSQTVVISCSTPGAKICYTTNGSEPTAQSATLISGSSITVARELMLKVKAFKDGFSDSATTTSSYLITGSVAMGGNQGGSHVVTLRTDGTVWSYGYNNFGQLGDGTSTARLQPVQVKTNASTYLTGVKEVAAGLRHTLALKADGTVVAWGKNSQGQLGNQSTTISMYPVVVQKNGGGNLTGVVGIAAGEDFSAAYTSDGKVWAWGVNSSGQLGQGTTADSSVAVQVQDTTGVITNAIGISAGAGHLVILRADKNVFAVGLNTSSQLGNGSNVNQSKAVPVREGAGNLGGVSAVSCGAYHSLAVIEVDGTVRAWGLNTTGQLGNGTLTAQNKAVPVSGLTDVVDLAAGANHSLALKANLEVWGWGDNYKGKLGTGNSNQSLIPIRAAGSTTYAYRISAKGNSSALVRKDGAVMGFGENLFGNFGNNTKGYTWMVGSVMATSSTAFTSVRQISASGTHSSSIRNDESVWSWGNNQYGQLGNNATSVQAYPVKAVPASGSLSEITQTVCGGSFTLALKRDGTVWAWGNEANGRLGNMSSTGTELRPVQVLVGASTGLADVTQISAGDYHGVARKSDGTVWAWGYNLNGQLGDGTTTQRLVATQVKSNSTSFLMGVSEVAAGGSHTLFRKSDGTVWAVGLNSSGQLGNNTTISSIYPVQIQTTTGLLTGVMQLAAGTSHNLALLTSGSIYAWGNGSSGQLGNNTTTAQQTKAVLVSGGSVYQKIAAGETHSLAVRTDHTVVAWGANEQGQLGNGTVSSRLIPTAMNGVEGASTVAAGAKHSLVLKSDGTVLSVGGNILGSLGQGTVGHSLIPVEATSLKLLYFSDSDGDTIIDSIELTNGTNPESVDTDADGLPDNADPFPLIPNTEVTVSALRLPKLLSNHAVLQRSASTALWGTASPNEVVTASIAGVVGTTTTGANGKWRMTLNLTGAVEGPHNLVFTGYGGNTITVSDVLIGDVWVAGGQSNMLMTMAETLNGNAEAAGSANTKYRHFNVKKMTLRTPIAPPVDDVEGGSWVVAGPGSTATPTFSAVGYYFGKKLQQTLNIPVGVINPSWGGTSIEAWMSRQSLDSDPSLNAACITVDNLVAAYYTNRANYISNYHAWSTLYHRDDVPFNATTNAAYAGTAANGGTDVNMAGWTSVNMPGTTSAAGLADSGAIWLRKTITLSASDVAAGNQGIMLGDLNGFETVYFNGTLVREALLPTSALTADTHRGVGWSRVYYPSPLIKRVGENVIAVRIFNPAGNAKITVSGILGAPTLSYLRRAPELPTSLEGPWFGKNEFEFPVLSGEAASSYPALHVYPYYIHNPIGSAPPLHSHLFNGMIHPLTFNTIKGIVWYQGESNVGRAQEYEKSFGLMIDDWRSRWGNGSLPFYFCQIANYLAKTGSVQGANAAYAELRESQTRVHASRANTGQAILMDLGESADIHYRDKKRAGERLSLIALAKTYGQTGLVYSGPEYLSKTTEGNKIRLTFKTPTGGLVAQPLANPYTYITKYNAVGVAPTTPITATFNRTSPSSQLEGFQICGADGIWAWADDAHIDGETVLVSKASIPSPQHVRYCWANNPTGNLYNSAGLPAGPFRTDNFSLGPIVNYPN